MNHDAKVEVISNVIQAFFEEVDPDDFDSDDLAEAIVRALNKAAAEDQ